MQLFTDALNVVALGVKANPKIREDVVGLKVELSVPEAANPAALYQPVADAEIPLVPLIVHVPLAADPDTPVINKLTSSSVISATAVLVKFALARDESEVEPLVPMAEQP